MLNFIFKQDVFVKHYATATKSEKVFLHKGQSQGHKVIDRGVIWKNAISRIRMPNMKSVSFTFQKL